ncbi:MAG: DNA-3-methyladenine glycosylase 2 family protein [Candidatus Dormibacteraeota bacterium]|nr:DNA-3-methyladenine glycosylase 2 family protein [Candidatus Dormibacteraeota bacterium]
MATPLRAMSTGPRPGDVGHPSWRWRATGPGSASTLIDLLGEAPFRLDFTVWALRRRGHNQVDQFDGTWYRRILVIDGAPVGVAVRQQGDQLEVVVRGEPQAVTPEMLRRVGTTLADILGLGQELSGFYRARKAPWLEELAGHFRGMRPPRFPGIFEAVVNAVVCQQVSLTVGIHLLNRLSARFGTRLPQSIEGWGPGAPEIGRVAEAPWESVRGLGLSGSKSRTLVTLAHTLTGADFAPEVLTAMADQALEDRLRSLPGIGRWSAQYVMLRGLGRWSILPGDDVAAQNSLRQRFQLPERPRYKEVQELSQTWSPYAGLVYFHLLLAGLEAGGAGWLGQDQMELGVAKL